MKRTYLFFILISLLAVSCREKSKPERVAERFLSAYLDCRYQDAELVASAQVMEQMRWRLSQLTQAEVELINENMPQVTSEGMETRGDSCIVWLRATDVLLLDSIGFPGHVGDRQYRLVLCRPDGRRWQVVGLE